MKISHFVPKLGDFKSPNGPLTFFSFLGGLLTTGLIGFAISQVPWSVNLWLAIAVSGPIVLASFVFFTADRRHNAR